MNITTEYLRVKGLNPTAVDPTNLTAAKRDLIVQALTTLIKRDYATQDLLGRYIDKQFEVTLLDVNLQDFRQREEAAKLQYSQLGWRGKNKLEIKESRFDEVVTLFAMACSMGSVQSSPGDVTMNSFRIYDVLRLIEGDDFDVESDFTLTDDTPTSVVYFRFKYFTFIVDKLRKYIRYHTYDDLVAAVYTMPSYQLIPCLMAAFRVYEQDNDLSTIRLAHPIVEPKTYSVEILDELLNTIEVKQTPEWLKVVPLVTNVPKFLNSNFGKARLPMPWEGEGDVGALVLTNSTRYVSVAPVLNFSIIDHLGSWKQSWASKILATATLATKIYTASYDVVTRGYYMASSSGDVDTSMDKIYDDTVLPGLYTSILDSLADQRSERMLSPISDVSTSIKNVELMKVIVDESRGDIFTPVLDYTSRRELLANSLQMDGKTLPMYYSLTNGEIKFST